MSWHRPEKIRNVTVTGRNTTGQTTLQIALKRLKDLLPSACPPRSPREAPSPGEAQGEWVSLAYNKGEGEGYLVRLLSAPSDRESDLHACLRLTDATLLLTDPLKPLALPRHLRASLSAHPPPLLMFNKLDLALRSPSLPSESLYQTLSHTLQTLSMVPSLHPTTSLHPLDPQASSVYFGSGQGGWGFTLSLFGDLYKTKFGVSRDVMVGKLWGDHYYDPVMKKWLEEEKDMNGNTLKRGFVKFIVDPLKKLIGYITCGETLKYRKILSSFGVELKEEEISQYPNNDQLLGYVLSKFLPLSSLLDMLIKHVPSPVVSQGHRVEYLYCGEMDDRYAAGMRECDPNGPLVCFISKFITKDTNIYAVGRVFSGRILEGQNVQLLLPDSSKSVASNINNLSLDGDILVPSVPAGNIVVFEAPTNLTINCTITDTETSIPMIRSMRSTQKLISMGLAPKEASELPKLIEATKRLAKLHSWNNFEALDTGEFIISSDHIQALDSSLKELESLCPDVQLFPLAKYRETVTDKSDRICLAKSPNKHSRLWTTAEPLTFDYLQDIESGDLDISAYLSNQSISQKKRFSSLLASRYGWEMDEARKIWSFGPENIGDNVLVDITRGIQYLHEIKDNVIKGFNWAAKDGPLCAENVYGVNFKLHDVILHSDSIHRSSGQIIPTARRVLYSSMYTAKPAIMEPILLIEAHCDTQEMEKLGALLNLHRGYIVSQVPSLINGEMHISAYLPASDCYKFRCGLGDSFSPEIYVEYQMDHWDVLTDPFGEQSYSNHLIKQIRRRKGMSIEIPPLDVYLDLL